MELKQNQKKKQQQCTCACRLRQYARPWWFSSYALIRKTEIDRAIFFSDSFCPHTRVLYTYTPEPLIMSAIFLIFYRIVTVYRIVFVWKVTEAKRSEIYSIECCMIRDKMHILLCISLLKNLWFTSQDDVRIISMKSLLRQCRFNCTTKKSKFCSWRCHWLYNSVEIAIQFHHLFCTS